MTFIIWYTRVPVYPSLGWWKMIPNGWTLGPLLGCHFAISYPGESSNEYILGPNATMPVTNHIF